ncbi:MAG: aminoglycoside phosphotransferase family protein [Bryobacteraceae bacterium]|nr:aminoglycoside phosphotransferase family protein [Bryobacteraceae bacterium]
MFDVPKQLRWLESSDEGRAWLNCVSDRVAACAEQWSLRLGAPYDQSYVSIVFPATISDGTPAVLKIQFPHRESAYEAEALRRWNGNGAVRLYDSDSVNHAMLIERCEPGHHLSTASADEALDVFIGLLPGLWVDAGPPFTSLHAEAAQWRADLPRSWERAGRPYERELLNAALNAINELSATQGQHVLIHQDLHGDNVLRAQRTPWLVIDPKPLIGEREFSVAPIVRSYEFGHSRSAVIGRLDQLCSALKLDRERARLWAMVQTLAWATDGERHARHIETARWLWQG